MRKANVKEDLWKDCGNGQVREGRLARLLLLY
jgi:hypothetical protein